MKKRILSCLMALALCLTLLPTAVLAVDTHAEQQHCLCGTSGCNGTVHGTASTMTIFNQWLGSSQTSGKLQLLVGGPNNTYGTPQDTQSNKFVLTEGNYYLKTSTEESSLDGDVKIKYPIQINGNVTICLNGKTIESSAKDQPVFEVTSGSTLTLTDCKGNAGKVKHTSDGSGSGVKVENGGTFNMYGGTITGNKATTGDTATQRGGGVYVDGTGSTFTMNGGTITDNTATKGGGGVYVSGGTFTMKGNASVTSNRATDQNNGIGGGVYVVDGTFTMNDNASVSGNNATSTDGGVGVYTSTSTATFTMNGGTIRGNNATKGGGVGVYRAAKFEMNGGTISDNTANQGGGVYVDDKGVHKDGATFTMNNTASVSGNTANQGGGVYVESGTFDMNDGTITGNTAKNEKASNNINGGGVYVSNNGTFNMNDGAISDNKATNSDESNTTYGGGVYVSGGTFTMNGWASSVSKNTAKNGGGVSVSSGKFNMNDGKISGNTGDGVFVHNDATFTVSRTPTVTGNTNTTNSAASNVYLMGSAYITIGNQGLNGSDGSIGVTKLPNSSPAEIVIANGVNEDYSGKFSSDDETREVKYENKQLVLKKKATQPSEHTHSYNENTWGKNATHHWHECTASDCTDKTGSIKDKAEHVYENNTDTTCNVCGYVRTVTTDPILVTKITLSPASPKLKVGQTQAMTVVIEPQTATKKDVTWKSSKPEVATVANDGTVTAHKAGTAEITATAEDDSKVSATCKVTVTDDTTTGGGTTPSQPGGSTGGNTGGSSSGGGSSSDRDDYDSNPIIKTETKNNPDGSTTKTETRRDGSVTQTTTGKDGSVSKTETKPDGSSVTENKAADGSIGTVKTDKNGQTEAKTALSNKAVEDAKKNGEAVKAPVEVEASRDSSTAPTVKVELPKNAGETEVEIPVSNAKPGTVAVLVHPDGTEEILKASVPTENGIRLTVDGSATVKIVDNSKGFIDTQDHWAKDAIDFVSARGLVNGMSATIYAPNNSTTRAQLWTILARQNDADLNGGNTWYEKAQSWSKNKGISDGTEPNAAINRAQMVTMLWRTMGQPAAGGAATFTDVPADSYYAQAVAWAVESGITAGVGGGRFDPSATCTRAQIAVFLYRYMK